MKFQLGDWTVQESANLLTRGAERVRLEKRVMAVLVQLIEARGGVVSKDDLIDKVWNGAAVSDHSVANAISDLRRTLGDDRKNPRYIETIPKRGYRLIETAQPLDAHGPTQATPDGAALETAATRFRSVSITAVLVLISAVVALFLLRPTAPPRLYLTDIENTTGDARYDIAANAATEMLTVSLAGGDYRLVRWRAPYTDSGDLDASGRDRILSGRIITDAGEPVMTLDVIDPADSASVWARAYPVSGGSFASIAFVITLNLHEPLGVSLLPETYRNRPDITESYWRARYLWSLREHTAIREARRILEGITLSAPDFAPAHAALADIYAHKSAEELAVDRAETYPLAEHHLAQAEALNPDLPEALVTRAYLAFFRDRNADEAMAEIDKAIAGQPDNAVAWQTKAMIASAAGDAQTSLGAVDRAHALDPLSAGILWDKVWFLYIAGRYEEAAAAAQEARRRAPPVHVYEALIHLARGDNDAAFASWLARAAARGLSEEQVSAIGDIAETKGAREGLRALAQEAARPGGYSEVAIPQAVLQASLSETDAAVNTLLTSPPREKSWWWSWYAVIPGLEALREDPRLAPLSDPQRAAGG